MPLLTHAPRCVHKARMPPMGPTATGFGRGFRRILVDQVWTPERVERVARAMRTQDLGQIAQVVPVYDPDDDQARAFWAQAQASFDALYSRIIETSGKRAIASLNVPMSFALDNPFTRDTIAQHTGNLITGLSESSLAVVRTLLDTTFAEHHTTEELADMLRPVLALDERTAARLAAQHEAMVDSGIGEERAARLIRQQAERALGDRAELVARTEVISAEERGRQAAWQSAVDEGVIDPGAKRTWVAAIGSERTCPICEELDGQVVGLDEQFHSAELGEDIDGPPGHPRCRCATALT